nr:nuclear transport factor 2 family protein [Micromonospora sp. DSM 115978]
MYARIVRGKVRQIFDEINKGNYRPMVDGLADNFTYRFHGQHALGGVRTTKAAMERWWERTLKLLPGATFDIHEILVSGGPGRTRLAVRSTISGPLPNGETYRNDVFQFMTLSWGKVTEVETVEDLQVLTRALRIVAEHGEPEAAADPING